MDYVSNLPATNQRLDDILDEYDQKKLLISDEIKALEIAFNRIEMAATVKGAFADRVVTRPYLSESNLQKNLLISGWKAVYNYLQIDMIASAKDKKRFEQGLQNPPELTFDNVKATFGDYSMRPRYHILRGLAEVFVDLDPAYKSHSKVKIGVKGLPKRVIISWGGYSSYGRDKFRDIANALAAYQNKPVMIYDEFNEIDACHRLGKDAVLDGTPITIPKRYEREEQTIIVPNRGLTVRKFNNGNAHIIFSPEAALDINRALAEFYGEVLPDVEDEKDGLKPKSTAVSKDLQFYGSPRDVITRLIDFAGLYNLTDSNPNYDKPKYEILEPSCGDGRILDVLKEYGYKDLFGIEFDPVRATQSRSKGHAVLTANFLEHPPTAKYDRVVMNPPFYGKHYQKHVEHALKFLKTGGILVSVLPATAHYDHDFKIDGYHMEWRDLPVASFTEVGTNVPTIMLKVYKR